MYTLYFSPGSCSLIVNCLLEELEVPFDLKRVDFESRQHQREDYRKLNPKGKVAVLVTPQAPLTECMAILEHACDRHDARRRWLPEPGSWERARALERVATRSGGASPDVSDLYFMVVARWGRWLEDSALRMPNIERFFRRMTERPAVKRAMQREGIEPSGS